MGLSEGCYEDVYVSEDWKKRNSFSIVGQVRKKGMDEEYAVFVYRMRKERVLLSANHECC